MSRSRIIVILSLCVFCFAAGSTAATKFTCTSSGKAWSMSPGTSPIEIVAMFTNAGTDCDLIVDDGLGNYVALGVCMESRYEAVKFGPLPGVPIRITAIKASGPNSKGYLRISDSFRVLRGGGDGLREIGSARELARRDPAYARMLERVRLYQNLKRPVRQSE